MELDGLVYPQAGPVGELAGIAAKPVSTRTGTTTSGEKRISLGLRDWRPGDPPRRIAWKVLARTGQTLVSEYRSGSPAPLVDRVEQRSPAPTRNSASPA